MFSRTHPTPKLSISPLQICSDGRRWSYLNIYKFKHNLEDPHHKRVLTVYFLETTDSLHVR